MDLLVSMAASVVIASVKNPARRAALKAVMLKIFNVIKLEYRDDPDFTTP